jgi:hypothetical protein
VFCYPGSIVREMDKLFGASKEKLPEGLAA